LDRPADDVRAAASGTQYEDDVDCWPASLDFAPSNRDLRLSLE
jgi:hypothetical protein